MRPTIFMGLLWLVSVAGCKTRDPDAVGLLDQPEASDDSDAAAPQSATAAAALALAGAPAAERGRWELKCWPADDQKKDQSYEFVVLSTAPDAAGQGTDQPNAVQPMQITVTMVQQTRRRQLGTSIDIHGQISNRGPMLLAFAKGVLTGEIDGSAAQGILTLSRDLGADATKVICQVKATRG